MPTMILTQGISAVSFQFHVQSPQLLSRVSCSPLRTPTVSQIEDIESGSREEKGEEDEGEKPGMNTAWVSYMSRL